MPNHSRKRRVARAKSRKNSNPVNASLGQSINMASISLNDVSPEEPVEQTKKPDLMTTEAASENSNESKSKDSKAGRKFIYNEETLGDEAIMEKIEKERKAAGDTEPGCILKLNYANGPDQSPTPVVLTPEDITPEKSGGLLKIILKEGEGEECPGYGDRVVIEYEGYVLKGKEKYLFETNVKALKNDFGLGRGEVIKGWDLGISTMKRGEKACFIIGPLYGYGITGTPKVPAHSTLMYNIELLDWKLEDLSSKKDGGILRKIREKGEGSTHPNDGSQVKVKLLGLYNGKVFEDCVKEFILGEGCYNNIPDGIEMALYKFQLKEKSTIYLKDKYGFEMGMEEYGIPPMAPISYDVTLLSFKKVKDIWEMNTDEKYEKALQSKERGIEFVKKNNYKVALRHFKWIMTCLEKEPGVDPDSIESRNALLLSGYLNITLCLMKLENYKDAIKFCDKALKMNPENEKALYRRGQAKMMINDCDDALKDFTTLQHLYPENKAASALIAECRRKIKNQQLKDKSTFGRMFDKFVKQDQERMRNMKTETGVWEEEDGEREPPRPLTEAERLIEQNNSLLRDANIIELSNNICEKF